MRVRAKYVSVKRASAVGVADRWMSQYCRNGQWSDPNIGRAQGIYDRLVALGPTPDIDKVAEIIGNKSWSYLCCDGCNEYVTTAVTLGEYEPKSYCATCIAEAAEVLKP